jgi:SpoVK/Ycf46/Vps4 family AAA+-type ATPase
MVTKGPRKKGSFKIIIDCREETTYWGLHYILKQYFNGVKILAGPEKYIPEENTSEKNTSETEINNAKKDVKSPGKHTLDDVIGLDEAKNHLRKFTVYDKFKKARQVIGIDIPKGFVLYGDPGVGKTYLYEAVINEAKLNGIKVGSTSISPATHGSSYINKFSLNIMEDYKEAVERLNKKETELELIFLDETDSITRNRENMQSSEENVKVVNTFNEIIDGIHRKDDIYFICCTNRIKDIDSAFIRSGRITPVECPRPCKNELHELFKYYVQKIKNNSEIDLFGKLDYDELTAAGFEKEFTGADVKEIFMFAGAKCLDAFLDVDNASSIQNKITQKDLISLIENFDMHRKGVHFKKNAIGFNHK